MSWSGGDPDAGDTVTYDVYFGTTTSPPLVAENQPENIYDPGTLNYSTRYYWRIVATDNHGASNESAVWSFTTTTTNPTLVYISPLNQTVSGGQSFTVNISVEPGAAIAGMQLNFAFNGSLVKVNSVTEGNLFKQNGSNTLFNPGTIDNVNGVVTYVYGCILNTSGTPNHVSTPDTFAIVDLTASSSLSGTSLLELANVKVSDPSGAVVPVSVTNGTVEVIKTNTTGERCDVNDDGIVDILDLVEVGQHFGEEYPAPPYPRYDVNEDGTVDISDITIVGQHFGEEITS